MLNTLNNIDPKTAQGILANLALGMIPDPGIEPSRSSPPIDADLRERLLHELRIRLRLKRDDNSPRAMAKLYGALADEMKRIALQSENVNSVKARLGQQGILSSSEYQIKFLKPYSILEESSLGQYQVEGAIRRPDSSEHLIPEHFGFDPDHATSLFLKIEKATAHSERYIILVLTNRKGYVHEVLGAWRVYPSDVDLSRSASPLDVLKALVETFGETFTLGEKTGKLFINERLRVQHKEDGQNFVNLFTAKPSDHLTYFCGTGRRQGEVVESVLSFSFDFEKYADSLKRHGIHVDIKKIKAMLIKQSTPSNSKRAVIPASIAEDSSN